MEMNDTICKCNSWAREFSRLRFDDTLPGHHPYCDGTGQWKALTEVPNRETTTSPELVEVALRTIESYKPCGGCEACGFAGDGSCDVVCLDLDIATELAEQVRELTAERDRYKTALERAEIELSAAHELLVAAGNYEGDQWIIRRLKEAVVIAQAALKGETNPEKPRNS